MARAFTAADVVQSNPGTEIAVATATPALLNPSGDGTGGIVIVGATTQVNPSENWHYAAQTGVVTYGSSVVAVLSRADLPAGEQTWPLASAGTPSWCWIAEEWTNLSYEPVETSAGSGVGAAPASLSSGSTGAFTAEYVVGVAALLVFGGGTGSTAWSAVTWSNSFVETDVVQIGDGLPGGSGDIQLRVARRYGTQNETGPWDTTVTFTDGAQTGKTCYLCLAVLRAEDVVEQPAPTVLSVVAQ
jgi:hypothetical protein